MCGTIYPICFLTDKTGEILDPYMQNSINYTVVSREKINPPFESSKHTKSFFYKVSILIEGYISLYFKDGTISTPVKFNTTKQLFLKMPPKTYLHFSVRKFCCCAYPKEYQTSLPSYEIYVLTDTIVRVLKEADIFLQSAEMFSASLESNLASPDELVCISTNIIYDRKLFRTEAITEYEKAALRAEVYQYNTKSDGIRKTYTNSDELLEYGSKGILNPNTVSFLSLFINGILQPPVNYSVEQGLLTLETTTVPIANSLIIIRYTTFKDKNGQLIHSDNYQYNAISDGIKKVYTNSDELVIYGNRGILNPNEVSYYNLYINGELEPRTTYSLSECLLTLSDAPLLGSPISIEFIVLKDLNGNLLKGETYDCYN